jgi:hypothetical protein
MLQFYIPIEYTLTLYQVARKMFFREPTGPGCGEKIWRGLKDSRSAATNINHLQDVPRMLFWMMRNAILTLNKRGIIYKAEAIFIKHNNIYTRTPADFISDDDEEPAALSARC